MHAASSALFDAATRYEPFRRRGRAASASRLSTCSRPLCTHGALGRVRRQYTSTDALPLIPGIDAWAARPGGQLLYFVAFDDADPAPAGVAVIDRRRAVALPDDR